MDLITEIEAEFISQEKQNLFEINQKYYTDPCVVCKHRFRDYELCENCVYYESK
jgi:hypothetical protein